MLVGVIVVDFGLIWIDVDVEIVVDVTIEFGCLLCGVMMVGVDLIIGLYLILIDF